MRRPAPAQERAEKHFRRAHGILRTRNALRLGIQPATLYALRDRGRIESLGRGIWHLVDMPYSAHVGLAAMALRHPRAVVCLVSALQWHELTTQLPRQVQIALPPSSRAPRAAFPPVRVFRFSGRSWTAAVERHVSDGVTIKVYGVAKTIADCFKFRRRVGMDVVLEALYEAWRTKQASMDDLWTYARVCRVETVMRPYLLSLGSRAG